MKNITPNDIQKDLFGDKNDPHKEFLLTIPNLHLVVNRRYQKEDRYIGRGSKWGNPFKIGEDGDRLEVIERYRLDLWRRIISGDVTAEELLSLEGLKLGCYCSPLPCHGHVILKAIDWATRLKR